MQFRRIHTVDEALDALIEWGEDGWVMAGGTDLMLQSQRGEVRPGCLLHIGGVEGLRDVGAAARLSIGPLVTHRQLTTDPDIRRWHPALASAAGTVGGWQTQAVGTVGGNVCNASPAADTLAPLLVADAHVTLASTRGERRMAREDFIVGRRVTDLGSDEMLTGLDTVPLPERAVETYLKLGRRGAMDVAIVGLAVRLGFEGGTVTDARVALCSVAPTARRVPTAEAALVGTQLDRSALDAAAEAVVDAAEPIDDARASASYRIRVLRGLLGRAVGRCQELAA